MPSQNTQAWRTLAKRELLAEPDHFRVSVEKVQLPDGRVVDDFYQIELREYVVIFAETDGGLVVAERHYKHAPRRVILDLPAGHLEQGEEPLHTARRELLEETGYSAAEWRLLGTFHVNGNQGCGKAHLFLARGVRKLQPPSSDDLEDTEVLLLPRSHLLTALKNGEVATLSSAAAIALATNPAFAR